MASEDALSKVQTELDTYAATKAAFKDAIASKGLTPTDVFSSYAPLIESITGGTIAVQDEKTVTFNGATVEIAPDEGYDGIRKVILSGDPNLRGINIVDAITMYGVTGSAKVAVSEEWPDDLPATEEEMDEAVQEDDESAPVEDKFVLMDNKGNVTTGYMYTEESSGLMVYNGVVLPELPETEYPYAAICINENSGVEPAEYFLWCMSKEPIVRQDGIFPDRYMMAQESGEPCKSYFVTDQSYTVWESHSQTTMWNYAHVDSSIPIWTNFDLYLESGAVFLKASEPMSYNSFWLTHYDPLTTEFKARGWRRVSKHTTGENAGKITRDDFTRQESGGWNYLKNIRSCTREKLYYKGVEVWPNKLYGAGKWLYNGVLQPPLPEYDRNEYPYAVLCADYADVQTDYPTDFTVDRITDPYPDLYLIKQMSTTIVVSETELPSGDVYVSRNIQMRGYYKKYRFEDRTLSGWTVAGSGTDLDKTYSLSSRLLMWANTDIYNPDGTLFLAASNPIPV